jgi:cytochrome c biogenesis protein CcmG/thiol:disulfide interchange protein DsbE
MRPRRGKDVGLTSLGMTAASLVGMALVLTAADPPRAADPVQPPPSKPAGAITPSSRNSRTLAGMVLEARGRRVVVARVASGSAAAHAGVLEGDVLLVLNDQALVDLDRVSPDEVFRILDRNRASSTRLVVGRGATTLGVILPAAGASPASEIPATIAVGTKAPVFTARDLEGREVSLAALRGRPVLIDFWASWCPPCRDAALALRRIADRYGDRLIVIGIGLDEDPHAFEAFVYNQHLPGYQVHDGGPYGPISVLYGTPGAGIPRAVLVSAKGTVAAIGRTAADLEDAIARLAVAAGPASSPP